MKLRVFALLAHIRHRGLRLKGRPGCSGDADFRLVFSGNAFEAPPHICHQRRRQRSHSLRRALVLWLLQPSPFTPRRR